MKPSLGVAITAALAGGVTLAAISIPESTFTVTDEVAVRNQPVTAQASAVANAKPAPKPQPLVNLDIEAPKYHPDLPLGIMFSSGWPIVFKAVTRDDALGIAMDAQPSEFPTSEETGYVVFSDPDGCLALPEPFIVGYDNPAAPSPDNPCPVYDPDPDNDPGTPPPPPPRPASDETYLEFGNDVDQVGVLDGSGNPGRSAALASPAHSGEPSFFSAGDPDNDEVLDQVVVQVGPGTGGSVADGVGYGADDDLPGLVLLVPHGVGLVLDQDFNRPAVKEQRNLAGFLNWTGYELRSAVGSTVIHAGMVLPYGLVAPLMQTDDCVGGTAATPTCTEVERIRVDGGPIVAAPTLQGLPGLQGNYPEIFGAQTYELRAFLVSGVAPSTLADLNGDGKVSARDAVLAGYNVISDEAVALLRQYHGNYCGGIPFTQQTFFGDFDGNGRVVNGFVCAAGPGVLTTQPR